MIWVIKHHWKWSFPINSKTIFWKWWIQPAMLHYQRVDEISSAPWVPSCSNNRLTKGTTRTILSKLDAGKISLQLLTFKTGQEFPAQNSHLLVTHWMWSSSYQIHPHLTKGDEHHKPQLLATMHLLLVFSHICWLSRTYCWFFFHICWLLRTLLVFIHPLLDLIPASAPCEATPASMRGEIGKAMDGTICRNFQDQKGGGRDW